MKKGVRCILIIFTLLAAIPRAPAVITHYVGTPVTLVPGPRAGSTWYLDGEERRIRLAEMRYISRIGARDPDNPDPSDLVTREAADFPEGTVAYHGLSFIADGDNPMQIARLPVSAMFDASAPLIDNSDRYPPIFNQEDDTLNPIVAFADGLWGNFEADPAASGYFAFRFDLNADGDDLIDQLQYGWARISFSKIIDTDAYDGSDFFIIIHEWGWADIGDTDFRIGAQPSPPLSIRPGSTGGVDIFWSGTSTVYQLQHKDDLITTNWIDTPETAVLDGITNTVNTPTSADLRFYRLTE